MLFLQIIVTYAVVTFSDLFFLLENVQHGVLSTWDSFTGGGLIGTLSKMPDLSVYRDLQTLSKDEFPIDDPDRRVILVGDIHGMYDDLQRLLSKISYDSRVDTLISVGDIVTKGTHHGSMTVLDFMASNNITAVRGNHDQKVIEWRSWINWIETLPGGREWLRYIRSKFEEFRSSLPESDREDSDVIDAWTEKVQKTDRKNKKWWNLVPKEWKLFQQHFQVAYDMTDAQFKYMVSKPLRIHVPHAHAFIVHAGVLSSDPTKRPDHKDQPLAQVPVLPHANVSRYRSRKNALRRLQELAVLNDIPQNRDPWVTLNLRGIEKNGSVTREHSGTQWAKAYNKDVELCAGFDYDSSRDEHASKHKKNHLPCYPPTVLYGHSASRGLDIKRWTIGLDSGCVLGRRMSMLILGGKYARFHAEEEQNEDYLFGIDDTLESDEDEDEYGPEFGAYDKHGKKHKSTVRFGGHDRGKIVSIACH